MRDHLRHLIAILTVASVGAQMVAVRAPGPFPSHCHTVGDDTASSDPVIVSARTSPRSLVRTTLRHGHTSTGLLRALRYVDFGSTSIRSVPRVARTLCLLARSNYSLLRITRRQVLK